MFFYRLFLWDCASLCVSPPFWAWRRRIHGFRTKATSIDPISLQLFPGSAWVLQQKSSRIQSIHLDGYVGDASINHDKCPICQLDCRVTCFLHYHLLHHSPVPYTTGLTMSSDPGNCRLPSASDHAARGCVQRDEPLPGDTISGGNGTFSDWNRRGRSTMFMEVGQNLQMLGIVRFIVIPKMGLAIQHGQIAFRSFKLSKKHPFCWWCPDFCGSFCSFYEYLSLLDGELPTLGAISPTAWWIWKHPFPSISYGSFEKAVITVVETTKMWSAHSNEHRSWPTPNFLLLMTGMSLVMFRIQIYFNKQTIQFLESQESSNAPPLLKKANNPRNGGRENG